MREHSLLIIDLDGTLLGDDYSLAVFDAFVSSRRSEMRLAYVSSRKVDDIRALVHRHPSLPKPNFVIGMLGTEAAEFGGNSLIENPLVCLSLAQHAQTVRAALSRFIDLQLQPDLYQSRFKVSYFYLGATHALLEEIEDCLAEQGIEAEVIYSGGQYLDVLPKGVNLGSASRRLADSLGVPYHRVVVCADSSNDLSLFQSSFRAVLIPHARIEGAGPTVNGVYRAGLPHTAGVIEGVRFWEEQWLREEQASAARQSLSDGER